MKKLFAFLVLALSISGVWASEPEVPAPSTAKQSQIVGKVTDFATGETLAGVTLQLKGSDNKTYTDLDGNFKLEGVAPGTYDIDVSYVSYRNITLTKVSTSSTTLNLKVELESVNKPL